MTNFSQENNIASCDLNMLRNFHYIDRIEFQKFSIYVEVQLTTLKLSTMAWKYSERFILIVWQHGSISEPLEDYQKLDYSRMALSRANPEICALPVRGRSNIMSYMLRISQSMTNYEREGSRAGYVQSWFTLLIYLSRNTRGGISSNPIYIYTDLP